LDSTRSEILGQWREYGSDMTVIRSFNNRRI